MKRNNTLPTNAVTVTSLVLPEQLAQQAADAVRELLTEAAAANTTRSYATALRYWAGWHHGRYGVELALPVSEAVMIQFLVDHIQRKSKAALVSELPPTLDQALVAAIVALVSLTIAARPADDDHHFGHSKAEYFWVSGIWCGFQGLWLL